MRTIFKTIFLCALMYMPHSHAFDNILGQWTTVDDKTGQKRAVVELFMKDEVLNGKIIKVYRQKGDTGICQKCNPPFKNKPIEGLQFMWGLKSDSNGNWVGGQILDAKTGKIYNAKLTLKGDKLYVRGYVGIALLGRTQVWTR